MDFRIEVDQLRGNGVWSNKAADMLPFALANFTGRHVRIFSSSEVSILDIEPTMQQSMDTIRIYLAYIGSTGVSEHYDGCVSTTEIVQQVPLQTINSKTPNTKESNENTEISFEQSPLKTDELQRGRPKGTPKKKLVSFMTPPKKKALQKEKSHPRDMEKEYQKTIKVKWTAVCIAKRKNCSCKSHETCELQ